MVGNSSVTELLTQLLFTLCFLSLRRELASSPCLLCLIMPFPWLHPFNGPPLITEAAHENHLENFQALDAWVPYLRC